MADSQHAMLGFARGSVHDRMFHVVVLGGIALVACGGTTEAGKAEAVGDAEPSDAVAEDGSFPSETNAAPPDPSTERVAPASPGPRCPGARGLCRRCGRLR
jgi:hypothetical protein